MRRQGTSGGTQILCNRQIQKAARHPRDGCRRSRLGGAYCADARPAAQTRRGRRHRDTEALEFCFRLLHATSSHGRRGCMNTARAISSCAPCLRSSAMLRVFKLSCPLQREAARQEKAPSKGLSASRLRVFPPVFLLVQKLPDLLLLRGVGVFGGEALFNFYDARWCDRSQRQIGLGKSANVQTLSIEILVMIFRDNGISIQL